MKTKLTLMGTMAMACAAFAAVPEVGELLAGREISDWMAVALNEAGVNSSAIAPALRAPSATAFAMASVLPVPLQ